MTTQSDRQTRNGNPPPRPGTRLEHRPATSTRELPRVPRRYGQWAGAVLFVLVAVLAAGWVWQQKSDQIQVLAITHPVSAGETIGPDDLKVVEVSGVDRAIGATSASTVEGKTASVGLVPGQILSPDMLTANPLPAPGKRLVGVEVDGTRAPGGLAPGDSVTVLAVPPNGDASTPDQLDTPDVLAEDASVVSARHVQGAGTRFTLQVPQSSAKRVAAFGAAGRVALVQSPLGGED